MIEYNIGDKKYILKPVNLGKWIDILGLIDLRKIKEFSLIDIFYALKDNIDKALAIVLTPEDVDEDDKDIEAIAKEIRKNAGPDFFFKVAKDFFICTDFPSLIQQASELLEVLLNLIKTLTDQLQLKNLSAFSQEGISQKETM